MILFANKVLSSIIQIILFTIIPFIWWLITARKKQKFTEWIGYAVLTWSPAGLLFAIWTFANLGPRARSLTEKYEKEFGEEYKKLNKKHIIPFIW